MLGTSVTTDPAALAASIADWWALAGVDVAVADSPRDWLSGGQKKSAAPAAAEVRTETAAPPPVARPAEPPPPPPPVAAPMPDELDAFLEWLADDAAQPEAAFARTRILPTFPSQPELPPELLVVTDMPTQDDMAAGRLFSGADEKLLAGMMRAIGRDMQNLAMTSLLLARPAGGIVEDEVMRKAGPRLVQLVRLLAPKTVILLGDRTSRAFEQTNGAETGLSTRAINLDNGTVSILSLPAPFVLLRHPERKAAAWAQLRHLAR